MWAWAFGPLHFFPFFLYFLCFFLFLITVYHLVSLLSHLRSTSTCFLGPCRSQMAFSTTRQRCHLTEHFIFIKKMEAFWIFGIFPTQGMCSASETQFFPIVLVGFVCRSPEISGMPGCTFEILRFNYRAQNMYYCCCRSFSQPSTNNQSYLAPIQMWKMKSTLLQDKSFHLWFRNLCFGIKTMSVFSFIFILHITGPHRGRAKCNKVILQSSWSHN